MISVTENDILNGWHGSPTQTESEVSMLWHYSRGAYVLNSTLLDANHHSDLPDIIKQATENARTNDRLRNRHFCAILGSVIQTVKNNAVQR